jgi:O-methyltransferase involved in polyketide biosynthesis
VASEHEPLGFDAHTPSPARIFNYWIGGKDHFPADRVVAEQMLSALPYVAVSARLTRQFLTRAVTMLAAEHGIRQFLDIGSGLPTASNTHEVAQLIAPEARVVYVDNDPQVVLHARSLLRSSPEGRVGYLQADLRDADRILTEAAETLDLTQPIAIILLQVLHFIPEEDDPYAIVRRLAEAVSPGSYLVLAHGVGDADDSAIATRNYNQKAATGITLRSRSQVARFFEGMEFLGPGLVAGTEWLPDADSAVRDISFGYNGIARIS